MNPRRTMGRLLVVTVAGLLLIGWLVPITAPATAQTTAQPTGRISAIDGREGRVEVVFGGVGLAPGVPIDPATAELLLDGEAQDATAEPVQDATAGSGTALTRKVMLTLDTSGSLGSEGLAAEQAAARQFLESVPDDVLVGLVSFAGEVSEPIPPTTERASLLSAIDALTLESNTAVYDATLVSLAALGADGARSILLFTDGADNASAATLPETVDAIEASGGVGVDVVALGPSAQSPANLRALQSLATAGGGVVSGVEDTDALVAQFEAAAEQIASQLLVSGPLPTDMVGRPVDVEVRAAAGDVQLRDTATFTFTAEAVAPAEAPAVVSTGFVPGETLLQAGIVALFVGLAGVLTVALVSVTGTQGGAAVRRRLSIYTLSGRTPVQTAETTTSLGSTALARSAVDLAGRVVRRSDSGRRLTTRLESAGLPLKPAEWLVIQVGITFTAGLVGYAVTGGNLLFGLLFLVAGVIGPLVFLSVAAGRRRSAFLSQMPDVLTLMAGSLAAGYSLPQAMDTVVREGQDPVRGEFSRALAESRLGVPAEDAMQAIAARMGSEDFEWVVIAIRIQRQVGGNLAELLRIVADTLRERDFLRRHVSALSAEGRLSAWILGLLPVVVALALAFLRPEYIRVLYTDPLGVALIVLGVMLMAIGTFWLSRVVRVQV